jgi:hypothetical protein
MSTYAVHNIFHVIGRLDVYDLAYCGVTLTGGVFGPLLNCTGFDSRPTSVIVKGYAIDQPSLLYNRTLSLRSDYACTRHI